MNRQALLFAAAMLAAPLPAQAQSSAAQVDQATPPEFSPEPAPIEAGVSSLQAAMRAALETNPTIEARRARLEAVREQLPQVRSDILPSLSFALGADTRSSDNGQFQSDSDGWSTSLSASQLLFATGRVAANTRQARAQIASAAADYLSGVQDLLLQVTDAYARLREVRAAVEARQRQADNLEEQRRFQEARFEAGAATRTDLAQAQARLAQARTQLIQAQGGLVAASETYLRLVGAPAGDLAPASQVEGLPQSLATALTEAEVRNPALESARASEDAARAAVAAARANRGPTLSLQAGTSLSGDFENEFDDTSSESVGVRLALPLFTGGLTSSRIRQQRALNEAATFDRAATERLVRETVTTAFTGVDTARAAFASAQEQLAAAELAYRGVRLEQEVGLRATVEVLDQENELLTARLTLAAAERDVTIAERRLAAAVGGLIEPR
jgi:outer membrane protein